MAGFALDGAGITRTAERLRDRIGDRFPERGIHAQSASLVALAERAERRSLELVEPVRWVRRLYIVLGLLVVAGLVIVPLDLSLTSRERDVADWVQISEAAINDLLLLGAGVFFLITLETRVRRRRCLAELHQLRSFAHVIDMHQLTKNPQRIKGRYEQTRTASSPIADLTAEELGRYLDYCSELLSLSAKVAALYVQHFDDAVAVAAVNDIEQLTTGLSRKIWQKLMIVLTTHPEASPAA